MVRMSLEERRRRLIEGAIDIVGESGVSAASTRAISARADMPLAAFHYAFTSQQELMMAVLHTLVEREIADHGEFELVGDSQLEVVLAALLRHVDDVERRMNDYRALQELGLYAQHIPGFEGLPAVFRQRRITRLRDKLLAFQQATGVAFDRTALDLAKTLVLLADGITISLITSRHPAELRASLDRQIRIGWPFGLGSSAEEPDAG
ncbi:MAG: TetR family transcriptional regulator [Propionibacterium sp.]|nr:TetR family transcriptional regulator [Propionibacterium sp.]